MTELQAEGRRLKIAFFCTGPLCVRNDNYQGSKLEAEIGVGECVVEEG